MPHHAIPEFDLETDILIIGYGFAGASAAIVAADAGSSVMIVEKMPQGGGNSRYSAGQCFVAYPGEQPIRDLVDWLDAMCLQTTPRDVLDVFARGTRELTGWLATLGGTFSVPPPGRLLAGAFPHAVLGPNFPEIAPSQEMFDKRCLEGPDEVPPSRRLWELLSGAVAKREIDVWLNSPARDLITDEDGTVVGAVVALEGKPTAIRARKAVLLTCGGFAANAAMKHDYNAPKPLKFAGNPGNTGDGIKLALDVGADLWHMTRTSTFIGFQSPEFEAAFCIFFTGTGFVWVDKYGRRYIDETSIELHDFDRVFAYLDPDKVEFPRIPSWGIFDEATRRGGPLTWPIAGYNREAYRWSPDNSEEIKRGWIVKADTLAELSAKIGVAEDVLAETLSRYNADCEAGRDTAFGRPTETLKALKPPFYAIALHPVALNTQGGARRDARSRVIGRNGAPIRHLYSAGEFGSIWGYLYPGGGNVTEAMVFGRLAGANAAAETATA